MDSPSDMNSTKRDFITGNGTTGQYYSLPALAEQGFPGINRMPVSLRIVLESLLRNCDVLLRDLEAVAYRGLL